MLRPYNFEISCKHENYVNQQKSTSHEKEEDKSYLIMYVIVSFLLVAVTAWAILNETVDRRPWKNYQKQFYRLEYEKIKQNYNKERAGFESPEVQKKYGEAKNKLEHTLEDFKKPPIQAEYRKLSDEQKGIKQRIGGFEV